MNEQSTLQDRLSSLANAFSDEELRYSARLLAYDVGELELKLAAAQQRIKRLEQNGDSICQWIESHRCLIDNVDKPLRKWKRAKED